MCIELYINKILVFSQCEESKNISYGNLTYDNSTLKNSNFTLPLNYTYFPNYTRVNSTHNNSTFEEINTTQSLNYTYFPNYTRVNSTHNFLNYTNFTNTTNTSEVPLFIGTYNTSNSLGNMTVIQIGRVPSTTPIPNITVNETLPMASDAPAADFDETPYETTAEVVLKIVVPLAILAIIWICIIICRKKNKKKVHCVKMIENPYFGADVETPKQQNPDKVEIEHKDPDVKPTIEHKDPDIISQPKNHQESSTEPRL